MKSNEQCCRRVGWLLALLAVTPIAGSFAPHPVREHACRFWGAIGTAWEDPILTDQLVTGLYSLKALGNSNPDGWSVAYYSPALEAAGLTHPVIVRAGPKADHKFDARYDDAVFEMLALDPVCGLAHVRNATSGHEDTPDPHPFRRDDIVFAHNGTLAKLTLTDLILRDDPQYLERHPPDYEDPRLDSELFFLYVLQHRERGVERSDGTRSHATGDAIAAAALGLHEAGAIQTAANCLFSDGDSLFALRFDPNNQERYKIRYKKLAGCCVIASEPVGSDTSGWFVLPPKSLGIFTATGAPEIVTVYPPPGSWLSFMAAYVDDDTLGASQGNDDEEMDAGETGEIRTSLRNVGGSSATQISAVLRTNDSLCVVLDSVATFPDLGPGDEGKPLLPFVIHMDPEVGAYHATPFTLEVSAEVNRETQFWHHTFTLFSGAPSIGFSGYAVDDGDDGLLDPGEIASLQVWLRNGGSEGATGLTGRLRTLSPHVEILQDIANLDSLQRGESDSLFPPFEILVSSDCPDPEVLPFTVNVSADLGISREVAFELPVGGFADNVEGGTGEWEHLSGLPGYGDAWHRSMLRNHTPGGSWSWKCGAVDSGGVYNDMLDAILVSPEVTLATHTELRFWHYIRAEMAPGHFGYVLDGGIVEASINGGSWQQVYPATGYEFLIAASEPPGPFPPETPVFSGFCGWQEEVFELTGYEGTIRFRFRFGSDGSEGQEGWYVDDVMVLGSSSLPADAIVAEELPLHPGLQVAGPCPFKDRTAILYDVARPGDVELSILDLEGRVIRHLVRGSVQPGRHRITWNGCDQAGRPVPAGLYFYRLRSRGERSEEVRRIIRLR